MLGGLTTEEIARAFLAPVATIAQRIVRAKRALAKLGRFDEACAEFKRAAALTRNTRERELLLERARAAGQY